MFGIGLKRVIQEDDIYEVKNEMRSDLNTEAFDKLWKEEIKKKNPSLFRVMFKLYLWKVLLAGFLFAMGMTLSK